MTTLIGLDIGGSKTHGVLFRDGQPLREATAGSANVQNVTPTQASQAIKTLVNNLRPESGTTVVAGAGGIDTDADAAALSRLLGHHLPGARISVVHDSRLILAAAGFVTGVAVIAGTGSAAWGRNQAGAEARFGGWGYLLGDEGSGYWLGREAVRHSLQLMNEKRATDQLSAALLRSTGFDDPAGLIAMFHSPDFGRHFWAKQARSVVDSAATGDPVSIAMLTRAGEDLARLAGLTARQLGVQGPIVLGGGLGMNVPALQGAFETSLSIENLGPVHVLDRPPVYGALGLASN